MAKKPTSELPQWVQEQQYQSWQIEQLAKQGE